MLTSYTNRQVELSIPPAYAHIAEEGLCIVTVQLYRDENCAKCRLTVTFSPGAERGHGRQGEVVGLFCGEKQLIWNMQHQELGG